VRRLDKIFQDLKVGTFFLINSPTKESRGNLRGWEAETSALHKKVTNDAASRITDGQYYGISPGQSVRIVHI